MLAIPHLGASTKEAEDNCAHMIVTQVKDFLEHGNIKNAINFPDCFLERSTKDRVIIVNKNIPAMIGKISNVFADINANIVNMVNKSKADLAYNILDLDGDISQNVLAKIRAIPGIIKVRKL
ncbi:MAG: D-3-phosphoglycerate dehydrogenase, partial [Candidatus Magnetoglobus multicellularis str. Araruama]